VLGTDNKMLKFELNKRCLPTTTKVRWNRKECYLSKQSYADARHFHLSSLQIDIIKCKNNSNLLSLIFQKLFSSEWYHE
jgi:hypothetical protein